MRHRAIICWLVVMALLTVGCAAVEARVAEQQRETPQREPATSTAEIGALPLPALVAECPVTLPGDAPFSPSAPYPAAYPYGGRSWYGTEALWTALPDDGRWSQLLHGDKVFWWRQGYTGSKEPEAALWMTAERLDGAGQVSQEPGATNAYHPDFEWAMLSGFQVPVPGCWEITGHYGEPGAGATLTFVVWVGE